jgi:hypothetical protein
VFRIKGVGEFGRSSVQAGCSTPPQAIIDIVLSWATWSDFERDCGLSRFWGGVHFLSAVAAGHDLGRQIGNIAFDFVQAHIAGTTALPAR